MKAIMLLGVCVVFASGCHRSGPQRSYGYVEGEFLYISSPVAGTLQDRSVQRGARVQQGEALFALDSAPESIARDQAQARLEEARARLSDARKGARQTELEALDAQLEEARVALGLAEREFLRQEDLFARKVATAERLDAARASRDEARHRVTRLEAERLTANSGAREDQVAASEANVRAYAASLAQAEWNLAQKHQAAPSAGLVFETYFDPGEWVAAGRPVLALLPPAKVKVRTFVTEPQLAALQVGTPAQIFRDGAPSALVGKVSFISPEAEYTPPVIYSQETRAKLMFRVELVFDERDAVTLHPGQPVEVEFPSR